MRNIFVLLLILALACRSERDPKTKESETQPTETDPVPVKVIVLKRTSFKSEIVSNGKLKALNKSNLVFNVSEKLVELNVKNGTRVKKGDIIARLRQEQLKEDLEQARVQLYRATLDLQDVLIGLGYDIKDSLTIPLNVMQVAQIRSGYINAKAAYNKALFNYNNSVLKAPFSGIVANIKHKVYDQVNNGEVFCTLIDDSKFEVEFLVMESELNYVKPQTVVEVVPYNIQNIKYKGYITEINPVVDENGLVTIKAVIENRGNLLEGMNVKVYIQNDVPGQLVVPKSAVVIRDNKEVLFRYTAGKAYWTYIKTIYENSSSYAVIADEERSATLNEGDTVIISNNLNLAHDSRVVIE